MPRGGRTGGGGAGGRQVHADMHHTDADPHSYPRVPLLPPSPGRRTPGAGAMAGPPDGLEGPWPARRGRRFLDEAAGLTATPSPPFPASPASHNGVTTHIKHGHGDEPRSHRTGPELKGTPGELVQTPQTWTRRRGGGSQGWGWGSQRDGPACNQLHPGQSGAPRSLSKRAGFVGRIKGRPEHRLTESTRGLCPVHPCPQHRPAPEGRLVRKDNSEHCVLR